MSQISRAIFVLVLTTSVACGGGVDKAKKPGEANNTSETNNMTADTVGTNNTSTNNTSTNNTSTNNTVATNNTIVTNNTTNTTSTNNTTLDESCVLLSSSGVTFGAVAVGEEVRATVLVENCSTTEPLTIDAASAGEGFDVVLPDGGALDPGAETLVTILFAPQRAGEYASTATLVTSAGDELIQLAGSGIVPDGVCPIAVARVRSAPTQAWGNSLTAAVGETAMLTGFQSMSADPIVGYEWSIVSRPVGSSSILTPNSTAVDPTIFLDMHGTYVVDLHVATATSPANCPGTQITILAEAAVDPNALVVTLVWNTPSDADQTDTDGTDMDLHYKTQAGAWNAGPYDCYWLNPDADWGADGQAAVDRDDTDGAGPEQITHSYPSPTGTYSLGAHYFSDKSFGLSSATIRVHQTGVLLIEKQKADLATDQFWYAGDYVMSLASLVVKDTVTAGFPP